MRKKASSKPYKLKIVLGKRQYRKGPTEKTMKSKLSYAPAYNKQAAGKRIRQIGRKLGS